VKTPSAKHKTPIPSPSWAAADSPRQEIVMIHVENERVSMYSGHGFIRSGFRQVGVTSLAELDLPH
jgi:hypothetical protein